MSDDSICVVGMHFAPETTGNAPYTTALVGALAESGVDVHAITGVPHYPQWKVQPEYVRGLRWAEQGDGFRLTRLRHAVPRKPDLIGRLRMESSFFSLAYPEVRRDRSSAVIAVSPTLSGLAAARIGARGRPVGVLVQDLNGNGARQAGLTGSRVSDTINRREMDLLRRASLVGVITPRFAEILVENGVDSSAIRLLPNFAHVEPVAASQAESRARLGWQQDGRYVVHTGNMGRKQGLETILEAARLHADNPRITYVLVGDGNQRSNLQRSAEGLTNLRFMDPVDDGDYPHVLNAADVLVLCERVGVKEMSLPSKLTSYSVAGRPIVASVERGSISAELLRKHDAAKIANAGSAESLACVIDEVLADPATMQSLVDGAGRLRSVVGGRAEAAERYKAFGRELLDLPGGP
ncbi:glycosyltransferase family 4 protein [Nakamurella flava]|uniref:Glycosyltransferase family 4 protein n=1 Tax=Nakamurella flava TaxID=2576308 RepID=A0A4U6QBC6_9ACTN|nr:glycosyltransferase family 4 protein [Nakamurella flava]TKV57357.1 glycosyltransferase family 4 protein [Nakamurella flava]